MTFSTLVEAASDDASVITAFLQNMSDELEEFTSFNISAVKANVIASFNENVHWFLFHDETGTPFGTCHLQSLHNYWRSEKRFYLGGFYIAPSHRGTGRFKDINQQLRDWATSHNGVQIYAHIHEDNKKSLQTFESVGLSKIEYALCANHWGLD